MCTEVTPDESKQKPLAVYTDIDDFDIGPGIALLEAAGFRVKVLGTRDPDVIVSEAREACALLVGYSPVTAEMLERLPNLKIIALASMGFDTVDTQAAAARGIWTTNILGAATEEVATHALALTLEALRGTRRFSDRVRAGEWSFAGERAPRRASSLTLGVVGLGRIGMHYAGYARGLFGRILGYDPMLPESSETHAKLAEQGVTRSELRELVAESDVLSLHLPLTEQTRHLVDAEFLAAMPQGATLINVSRGGLVDSAALAAAIQSGHIAGAGLDVLDVEPPDANHPLLNHPSIVLTPHVAFWSDASDRDYVLKQASNVVRWSETGRPDTPIIFSEPQTPEPTHA